ncbi:MAG: PorP/SprF family type IX secretion system membrane protein [Vicingaceae bacterium]
MKRLFYISLLFSSLSLFGQESHFTQYFNSSTFLNPSLSGIDLKSKATLLYRNHWPQLENSFVTQAFVYESSLANSNHGLSFYFFNDRAGDGNLAVNSLGVSYAHEFQLTNQWVLRSGIASAYAMKSIDWDKLVFEDMIDSREGVVYDSQQPRGRNLNYWDVSIGATLFSEKHHFGFSIDHLTEPDEGLVNQQGDATLSRSYTVHASTRLQLARRSQSLVPAVIYRQQNNISLLQLGALAELENLQFGFWYGSNQRLIVSTGLQLKNFGFTYAYDLYSSKILNRNLGSHEVSIQYEFESKKQRRKFRQPCPKF